MSIKTATAFDKWIDTFVDEKGLDREQVITVEGPVWGDNLIPLQCVIDASKQTSPAQQAQIKSKLVMIDFLNGDPMHFFTFLAKGMAL